MSIASFYWTMQLNTNIITTQQRKDMFARIEKMLKQKRFCFWYVRVDAQKQQLVILAERVFQGVKQVPNEQLIPILQKFSNDRLQPLLGSPTSKYYEHYLQLVNDIQNL